MIIENRQRFLERLLPYHPPSVMLDIELAYTMAKYSHRAQTRKEKDKQGEPLRYFEHPRRVALILIDEAKILLPSMIIASLLHDGIEDTRDLTPAMIEHIWGTDIVSMVKTLSKDPSKGYLDRFQLCTDWRPYLIKACDRLDNLRSMDNSSIEFRNKQLKETKLNYIPLFQTMIELAPNEFKKQARLVLKLILDEMVKQEKFDACNCTSFKANERYNENCSIHSPGII